MENENKSLLLCPYSNDKKYNCNKIPRIQLNESQNVKITCNEHTEANSQIFEISNYLKKNNNNINLFHCFKCLTYLKDDQFFFFCNHEQCKKFYCIKCYNKNLNHNHPLAKRTFSNFWNKCISHYKSYNKYCKTCLDSLCEDCEIKSHAGHDIIYINQKNEKLINDIKNNFEIQEKTFSIVKKIIFDYVNKVEEKFKLKKLILNNYLVNKNNGNSIENLNEIFTDINPVYKQKIEDLSKKNSFEDKILSVYYYYQMINSKHDKNYNIQDNITINITNNNLGKSYNKEHLYNNYNINNNNIQNKNNIKNNNNIQKNNNIKSNSNIENKINKEKKYINEELYEKVIHHEDILYNLVDIINVKEDGNCFYRVISYFLYKHEKEHTKIREEIFKKALYNQKKNPQALDVVENLELSMTQYINYGIKNNGTFAGDLEISTAQQLYNINIVTYRPGNHNKLSFVKLYNDDGNYKKDLLILIFINNNHFQLAYYKNNKEKKEKKPEIKSNENIGINKLKKEIENKNELKLNNKIENKNIKNDPPKIKIPSINEKYKNVIAFNEKNVIVCMIRLSTGNLALGLSNGYIRIYDINKVFSKKNNFKDNEEMDILLIIEDFKGKRISYLYELKDKTLLCATYSKIHHIKLINNDKGFEYIGSIDLSKRELPKKIIELGNEIIVSLGEKQYTHENIKRVNCLFKVFNKNPISKTEENSFCLFSDNESINSECSSYNGEYSNIYSSDEEDSFKSINTNDKKFKNDSNIKLYKNNENKDKIYICSIFPINSEKSENSDYIYQFIATSNKTFYRGENSIQIYGILKNPQRHGFLFFIVKTINDMSCSRMVDSICKINEEYIGIGLQKYEMGFSDGIALFHIENKEIVKIITGMSIGILNKSIKNNKYIFFTTNKTKDMKINNEIRLCNNLNVKKDSLSRSKEKLFFDINSGFTCLVELLPSKNKNENIYYAASYSKNIYIILIENKSE